LIITSGFGLMQREGGPLEEARPGDVVLLALKLVDCADFRARWQALLQQIDLHG
jgi:hypothetical protein